MLDLLDHLATFFYPQEINMKKISYSLLAFLIFSPVLTLAQLTGVKGLIQAVGGLINPLIAILVGLALLAFFWGLLKFIFKIGGDEKAEESGKVIMKWGLIAMFVMLSVMGIINFFERALLPGSNGSLPPATNPFGSTVI